MSCGWGSGLCSTGWVPLGFACGDGEVAGCERMEDVDDKQDLGVRGEMVYFFLQWQCLDEGMKMYRSHPL